MIVFYKELGIVVFEWLLNVFLFREFESLGYGFFTLRCFGVCEISKILNICESDFVLGFCFRL